MKVFKWIILGVVVLLLLAGLIVYLNLNHIVRTTVQTQASNSLNLQTTLGGADLSLLGGNLGLNNLQIASPAGFQSPQLLSLNNAAIDVSYGQLRQQPIHIQQITLNAPRLVIEQSGGSVNLKAAMDQMPKSDPNSQMHLIIDKLQVADATVVIRPGLPGVASEIAVPLPTLTLNNVGTGEGNQNGAAIKDVTMQVITAMAAKAADSDKLPPELKALLNLNLDQMAARLSQQFNQQLSQFSQQLGKKIGQDPQQLINDPGKALQQGLGNLLNQPQTPKKDKKK